MNVSELEFLEAISTDQPLSELDVSDAMQLVGQTLTGLYLKSALVGTAFILGPEKAADIDVLVLSMQTKGSEFELERAGFTKSVWTKPVDSTEFTSWKLRRINVLLTDNQDYFNKFRVAAEVSKYLELEDKTERVAVHRIIRDRATADEVENLVYEKS